MGRIETRPAFSSVRPSGFWTEKSLSAYRTAAERGKTMMNAIENAVKCVQNREGRTWES